jgi:hypothetical protein
VLARTGAEGLAFVIPAKAGIQRLSFAERLKSLDPSFRWDDVAGLGVDALWRILSLTAPLSSDRQKLRISPRFPHATHCPAYQASARTVLN